MHVTDAQMTILALVVLLVLSRLDLWRERRRSDELRKALVSMAAILKEGGRRDG